MEYLSTTPSKRLSPQDTTFGPTQQSWITKFTYSHTMTKIGSKVRFQTNLSEAIVGPKQNNRNYNFPLQNCFQGSTICSSYSILIHTPRFATYYIFGKNFVKH